ncbi:MAG: hypothetical protein ACPGN3_04245 [Opitutales bacterium]
MPAQEDTDSTHTPEPFRTYHGVLLTPGFHLSYALIIAAIVLIVCKVIFAWPLTYALVAGGLILISVALLSFHVKRFFKIELYESSVVLTSIMKRAELSYAKIERLHANRETNRLRIETKSGEFLQIDNLRVDMNRLMYHLEKAVYGQTI